jgi:hypothetical protein
MTHYNEKTLEDYVDYEYDDDNFNDNSFEKGNKYYTIFTEKQYTPGKKKERFERNYIHIYIDKEKILNRYNIWKEKINECFYENIHYKEFENRLSKFIYFKNLCLKHNINIDLFFNYKNYDILYLTNVPLWLIQCIGYDTFYTFFKKRDELCFSNDVYLKTILQSYYYGNIKIVL